MNRIFTSLLLFLWIISSVSGQEKLYYTHTEDFIFPTENDLIGFTFVPYRGKLSTAHYPSPINEGIVAFTVEKNTVLIDERARFTPGGIDPNPKENRPYRLHIARLSRTKYGYDIQLINEKNRDLIGYLKIYMNGYSQPLLLKFRPSMADQEHIYEIKPTNKKQLNVDNKFFTHMLDHDCSKLDELDDLTIYPFIQIDNFGTEFKKVFRIYSRDRKIIQFEKRTVQRGKKLKDVRHIVFFDGDEELPLSISKSSETTIFMSGKPSKVYELTLKDENTDEDYFAIIHRGAKSKMKAIELVKGKQKQRLVYYQMREGERLVD